MREPNQHLTVLRQSVSLARRKGKIPPTSSARLGDVQEQYKALQTKPLPVEKPVYEPAKDNGGKKEVALDKKDKEAMLERLMKGRNHGKKDIAKET